MKYLQIFILFLALEGVLIPGTLAAEELIHVVGKGDTIYSLSRFYHVSADELMKANGITDPSKISVGKRLIIPVPADGSPLPGQSSNAVVSVTETKTLVNYKVVRGDTLYSIARNNGITLQRLQEINGFSSTYMIKAGDVIKVPGNSASSNTQNNSSAANTVAAGTPSPRIVPPRTAPVGIYALRWPVTPKDISYMTGQMGVVVEGEKLESVRSLTQGNVVSAGPWRKFGRVIIVETAGGYYYMYGGCETITVNVGDRITPGMELGKLGINAVSVKPQLFFMVFRNDNPMDPALAPRAGNNLRT